MPFVVLVVSCYPAKPMTIKSNVKNGGWLCLINSNPGLLVDKKSNNSTKAQILTCSARLPSPSNWSEYIKMYPMVSRIDWQIISHRQATEVKQDVNIVEQALSEVEWIGLMWVMLTNRKERSNQTCAHHWCALTRARVRMIIYRLQPINATERHVRKK